MFNINKDDCSRPLGNFLIVAAFLCALAISAALFGIGTSFLKDLGIARLVGVLSIVSGVLVAIWLIFGMVWLHQVRPHHITLDESTGLHKTNFCQSALYYVSVWTIVLSCCWLPCLGIAVVSVCCGSVFGNVAGGRFATRYIEDEEDDYEQPQDPQYEAQAYEAQAKF